MATQLYTTEEAGLILGVHEETVRRWVKLGRIRGVELGTDLRTRLRIREDDLEAFINSRTFDATA